MKTDKWYRLSGSLVQSMKDFQAGRWTEYQQRLKRVLQKVRTDEYLKCNRSIVAFKDVGQAVPGLKPYKSKKGYLVPDKRTNAGKLLDSLRDMAVEPVNRELEQTLGIPYPGWFIGSRLHTYGMKQLGDDVFLLNTSQEVPDIDHPELIPLKAWEALKMIEEYEVVTPNCP